MIRINYKPGDEDYSGIEIAPLVDVVFLLLIFFLLTLASAHPSIELALPEASTALVQDHQESYVIAVARDGSFTLNNEPARLADLESVPKGSRVIVFEDKKGPYGIFVEILDTLRKNGIDGISIVTDEKND